MHRRVRLLLAVGLLVGVLLTSTGCLFNLFQTARMLGAGNAALTVGTGYIDGVLSPQARLALGLADGLDFGLQSGFLLSLDGGDPIWLGAVGDLKLAIASSEYFALAAGIGAGYVAEVAGWAALGEVLVEVSPFSPFMYVSPVDDPRKPEYVLWRPTPTVFANYQPLVPFAEDSPGVAHHFAGGVVFPVGKSARVLIQVDYGSLGGLLSYGVAIEITF